jgi:TM2 domain-containing membrane protein YozV/RNA polymerase subunit RPABC4/transcription elongation factor Spt4
MFCRNCGQEVSENAVACPKCGVPPRSQRKFCNQCGSATQPEQVMCVKCGVALGAGSGSKSKVAAGVLGILLGCLGIHKFYLGYTMEGIIMLLISVLTCGFGASVTAVIGIVEGIVYLTKTDEEFEATYVRGKRKWF